MDFPGTRLTQLLPVSRDDIDISKWRSGDEPITMTSIVDGKVIEHKPYDFTNIFQSQPAPVLSNEPNTGGFEPKYSHNWCVALETNLKGLAHFIKKCALGMGNVLEIGCYEGRGTALINEAFKPSVFVCCDPWDPTYTDIGFQFKNQYENFKHNTEHLGIVEMRMTSDEMFKGHDGLYQYDFIYIDGDHSYEQTSKDLKNSLSALRVGGLCLVDDYVWEDFTNSENPVRRAVNDFASEHYQPSFNDKKIIRVSLDDDRQFAFMRIV